MQSVYSTAPTDWGIIIIIIISYLNPYHCAIYLFTYSFLEYLLLCITIFKTSFETMEGSNYWGYGYKTQHSYPRSRLITWLRPEVKFARNVVRKTTTKKLPRWGQKSAIKLILRLRSLITKRIPNKDYYKFCTDRTMEDQIRRTNNWIYKTKKSRLGRHSVPVAQQIEALSLYGSSWALPEDTGFNSSLSRAEGYLVKNVVQ